MITTSGLGARLRQARELAGYSQQEAAAAVGVAREVISYWENERRVPGLAQLARLGEALGVSVDVLLGAEPMFEGAEEHELVFRGLGSQSPPAKSAVRRWLAFLDEWAGLLGECGDSLPGRRVAPVRSWRSPRPLTDSRSAARLAGEVRRHYGLGGDAIPDLLAFLDQEAVLVYRIGLDPIGSGEGISGIFFNHPQLGYCILVNIQTTPGRQTFTLAHEFAHALFHYQELGLVSRAADPDKKERFADAFAAHFLVPGEKLRQLVAEGGDGGTVSPFDVIRLHRYFRVSYATMLIRLRSEGLLGQDQYEQYLHYSPSGLAARLGLDRGEYDRAPHAKGVALGTYPASVLERVRGLVLEEELSPAAAADLLHVSQEEVVADLVAAFEPARAGEEREFAELPIPWTFRKHVGNVADC